ncbi:hypothetical protein HN51_027866 [Arachis hypogaea]
MDHRRNPQDHRSQPLFLHKLVVGCHHPGATVKPRLLRHLPLSFIPKPPAASNLRDHRTTPFSSLIFLFFLSLCFSSPSCKTSHHCHYPAPSEKLKKWEVVLRGERFKLW